MDAQRWLITRDIHKLVFVTAVVRTKPRADRTPPPSNVVGKAV